jgi:hypothetical protein
MFFSLHNNRNLKKYLLFSEPHDQPNRVGKSVSLYSAQLEIYDNSFLKSNCSTICTWRPISVQIEYSSKHKQNQKYQLWFISSLTGAFYFWSAFSF